MVAICRQTSMGDTSGSSNGQRRRCGKSNSNGSNVEKRAKQDVLENVDHHEKERSQCVGREEQISETTHIEGLDNFYDIHPCDDGAAAGDENVDKHEKIIVERQVVDPAESNSIQILTLPGITLSVTATVTIAFPGGNTLTGSSTPNPVWALPSTVISTETVSVNTETPSWPPPLPTPSLQPVPNPISASPLLANPSAEQPTLSTPAPSQSLVSLSSPSPSSSSSSPSSPTTTVTSFIPTLVSGDEALTALESSIVSTVDGSVIVFSYSPTTDLPSATSSSATDNAPPAGNPEAAPAPNPNDASSSGEEKSSGNNDNAKLPPILGGVFGALAGIGLVLWALLFIIRYRKRQIKDTKGNGGNRPILREAPGRAPEGGSKKQEMKAILGSGVGSLFGESSKEPAANQSFVRVSGRKVTSDLGHDIGPAAIAAGKFRPEGPGNDNAIPENPFASNEDGQAHMQESQRQSTQATIRASRLSSNEDDEPTITTFRSSLGPSDHGEGASRFPTPPPIVRRLHGSMSGVDGVGRSLPSQDGSKTSRFTEDV